MADPIIVRTIALTVGLRADQSGDPDRLGIYRDRYGDDVFAIERNGIRLLPERRWIAYREIEDLKLDSRVKQDVSARTITLRLSAGDLVVLRVDGEDGHHLDIFPIHAFVRRRVHQHRNVSPAP